MISKCIVCGKNYKHCPDCGKYDAYKEIADTITCYAVYLICIENRDGVISDDKAIEKLADIGITKDNVYKYEFNKDIESRILNLKPTVVKSDNKIKTKNKRYK